MNINVGDCPILIDRHEELRRLLEAYKTPFFDRKALVFFIPGESGSGKTTLVNHFLKELDRLDSSVIKVSHDCENENINNPLFPYHEILRQLLEIKGYQKDGTFLSDKKNKKTMKTLRKIGFLWLEYFTQGIIKPIVGSIETIIETFKDDILKSNILRNYDRDDFFKQFADILKTLILDGETLVVFFDNIHWVDISSLKMLNFLFHQLENYPIMFICSYRASMVVEKENRELISGRSYLCNWVNLNYDLGNINVETYINKRYKHHSFSVEFINSIRDRSGGNPFFLEQIFNSLEKEKQILFCYDSSIEDKRWILVSTKIDIPNSVREAIDRRLIHINQNYKKVLEFASVEGDKFTAQVVAQALGYSESKIIEIIEEIINKYDLINFLEEIQINEEIFLSKFQFSHKLIQEHIYKSLIDTKKRIYHKQISESYEKLFAENYDAILTKLIYHLENSGQYLKAIRYQVLAGWASYARFSWDETVALAKSALKNIRLINNDEKTYKYECDILIFWAECAIREADYQDISELMILSLPKFDLKERKKEYIKLLTELEYLGYLSGEIDAEVYGKKAVDEAEAYGDIELIFDAKFHYSDILVDNLSDGKRGKEILFELLSLTKTMNDLDGQINVLANLAWCLVDLGEFVEAIKCSREAIKIAKKVKFDDKISLAFIYRCAGFAEFRNLEYALSESYFNKAKNIYEEIGDSLKYTWILYDLSTVYQRAKEFDKAISLLSQCIKNSIELEDEAIQKWSYDTLSSIYMDKCELEMAKMFLDKSKETMGNYNISVRDEVEYIGNYARLLCLKKDYISAQEQIERFIQFSKNQSSHIYFLDLFIEIVHLFQFQNRYDEAESIVREILTLTDQISDNYWKMVMYELLGDISQQKKLFFRSAFFYQKSLSYSTPEFYKPLNEEIYKKIILTKKIVTNMIEKENQIVELNNSYPSQKIPTIISHVDNKIFKIKYFGKCLSCNFCNDKCCSYGVDIDIKNVEKINSLIKELKTYTQISTEEFFTNVYDIDEEFSGGKYTRILVVGGKCIFLNRTGRGCFLHSYCFEVGMDYHDLKPPVCSLFPLTYGFGVLQPSTEAEDGSLICLGEGPTIYEYARDELEYYFGSELIKELDQIQNKNKLSNI